MAGWTEHEDKELIRLCAAGLIHREIGKRIGRPKNSCISRARRLGISNGYQPGSAGRLAPVVKSNGASPTIIASGKKSTSNHEAVFGHLGALSVRSRPTAKGCSDLDVSEQKKKVESPDPVTLLEREDHQCGWPLGDPRDADFRYCGNKKRVGHTNYCEGHATVSTRPVPRRRNIIPESRDQRAVQNSALAGWS